MTSKICIVVLVLNFIANASSGSSGSFQSNRKGRALNFLSLSELLHHSRQTADVQDSIDTNAFRSIIKDVDKETKSASQGMRSKLKQAIIDSILDDIESVKDDIYSIGNDTSDTSDDLPSLASDFESLQSDFGSLLKCHQLHPFAFQKCYRDISVRTTISESQFDAKHYQDYKCELMSALAECINIKTKVYCGDEDADLVKSITQVFKPQFDMQCNQTGVIISHLVQFSI